MKKRRDYMNRIKEIAAKKAICDTLRSRRLALRLTQRAVAAAAGINAIRLCEYERGTVQPRPVRYEQILAALDRLEQLGSIGLGLTAKKKLKSIEGDIPSPRRLNA